MGYRIERLAYEDPDGGRYITEVGLRWKDEADLRMPTTEEMIEAISSAKAANLDVDFIEYPRMRKLMGVEVSYV